VALIRTHDSDEAAHLVATGGQLRRVARDMAVDLSTARIPEPGSTPEGLRVEVLGSDSDGIAAAAAAALLPEHVDFGIWSGVDRFRYWRQLLAGQGPCGSVLHAPSRLARDRAGGVVGAVVVTHMAASEWWSGDPWIPEIFVVADFHRRGLGSLLLGHAMRSCSQGGHRRLGLTVSEGNPARNLYERFGFRPFRTTWLIERAARR
jgi:GNAT superfamily N-acetyltransferase